MDMGWSKLQETVKDGEAWRAAVHGVAKSQMRLSNWTAIKKNSNWEKRALYIAYDCKGTSGVFTLTTMYTESRLS